MYLKFLGLHEMNGYFTHLLYHGHGHGWLMSGVFVIPQHGSVPYEYMTAQGQLNGVWILLFCGCGEGGKFGKCGKGGMDAIWGSWQFIWLFCCCSQQESLPLVRKPSPHPQQWQQRLHAVHRNLVPSQQLWHPNIFPKLLIIFLLPPISESSNFCKFKGIRISSKIQDVSAFVLPRCQARLP